MRNAARLIAAVSIGLKWATNDRYEYTQAGSLLTKTHRDNRANYSCLWNKRADVSFVQIYHKATKRGVTSYKWFCDHLDVGVIKLTISFPGRSSVLILKKFLPNCLMPLLNRSWKHHKDRELINNPSLLDYHTICTNTKAILANIPVNYTLTESSLLQFFFPTSLLTMGCFMSSWRAFSVLFPFLYSCVRERARAD